MNTVGNANMLRIARQLRRFQQGEAATKLGISQAMLSRFENELAGLSDDVLDRAAAAYDFPRSFFTQPDPILGAPVTASP